MKTLFRIIVPVLMALSGWAQPFIPSTTYTIGFMTNKTAASARNYLGITGTGGGSFGMDKGAALQLNGTDQFLARTNQTIRPSNFEVGSEIVLNNSFESFTGTQDSGNSTFPNWTQVNAGDAVYMATADAWDGTNAVKLSGNLQTAILQQDFTVLSGLTYTLSFWGHSDGTNAARIWVTDQSHGTNFLSNYQPFDSTTNWQYWSDNFVIPAGCTTLRLWLTDPGFPFGVSTFDAVRLREVHDMSFVTWVNCADDPTTVIRQYVMARLQGDTNRIWFVKRAGNDEVGVVGKMEFGLLRDGGHTADFNAVYSTTVFNTNVWHQIAITYQTAGLAGRANAIAKMYVDGVLQNTTPTMPPMYLPMVSSTVPLSIGGTSVSGNIHNFHGQIGETQIVLDYIFTAADVAAMYTGGIPTLWPGSTTTVLAHYPLLGSSTNEWYSDISGNQNQLSGYGASAPIVTITTNTTYLERLGDVSVGSSNAFWVIKRNLEVAKKLSVNLPTTLQTYPVQLDSPNGAASGTTSSAILALSDLQSQNATSGSLQFGINSTPLFYSWVQSRSLGSTTYFDLSLNPAGGAVDIGATSGNSLFNVIGRDGPPSAATATNGMTLGSAATSGVLNLGVDTTGLFYSWIQSRNTASATYYPLVLNPSGGEVFVGGQNGSSLFNVNGNSGPPNGTTATNGMSIGTLGSSGVLNAGVDTNGTFYSWIQSRNTASATYYPLELNPYGGTVSVGSTNALVTLDAYGDVAIVSPGKGLQIKEVAGGGKLGQTPALVGGTNVVANTNVTANSRIFLQHATSTGTLGILAVTNIVAGTSFEIVSSSSADTNVINWLIIEPY